MRLRFLSATLIVLFATCPLFGQGIKISALPAASNANTTDELPANQGGTTRKLTPAQMLALQVGGAGIDITGQTISTLSSEADFLSSGALTCGASTQGKVQVHMTPLQYCDNAATPTLRYACYGDSAGAALTGDSATAFFLSGEIEDARIPAAIARDSELPTESSLEAILDLQDLQGAVTDAQVPNTITVDLATLATTSTTATGLTCTTCVDPTDIASDAITEPKLKAVDTASDEECLTYETITGDFEWQVCSADTDDQTASEVVYTPADGTDWVNPDPDDVADGLDKLADRLTTEEAKADDDVPESGDFTNLALTGPVTSSGVATSIANDAITEAMLKSVNASTDEFCLTREDTTGDFEWQACGGAVNSFETITTQSDSLVADSSTDTLSLACFNGITCNGTAVSDQIAFGIQSQTAGFITDADTEELVCGTDAGGKMQVLDNGKLQYCDGNTTSVLRSGYLDTDGVDDDLPDADEVVESMLKAVDAAVDEECLTYETTTGDFEWQSCGSGGGTPGGSDTQVQFNDASAFGGDAGLVYNKTTDTLTAGVLKSGNLQVTGNTLSSTDTNGPTVIDPNGTGLICLGGSTSSDAALQPLTSGTYSGGVRIVNCNFSAGKAIVANEVVIPNDTTPLAGLTGGSLQLYDSGAIYFRNASSITSGANDSGFERSGANEINIHNGSLGGTGKLKKVVLSTQTLTIADNGSGTPATGTLTVTKSYAKCDCSDTDGCTVTMSESGVSEGWSLSIINISANACNFADTSGVSELPAGGIALGQYDSLSLLYIADRWVTVSTSNN